MKFSEKLHLLLKRQGIKQADLARAIGADPSRVSDWTNGRTLPSIPQGLRLARTLGVTLDYLADDEQDEPPSTRDEWEAKLLEVSRELGPRLAWRRLLGIVDDSANNSGLADANIRNRAEDMGLIPTITSEIDAEIPYENLALLIYKRGANRLPSRLLKKYAVSITPTAKPNVWNCHVWGNGTDDTFAVRHTSPSIVMNFVMKRYCEQIPESLPVMVRGDRDVLNIEASGKIDN